MTVDGLALEEMQAIDNRPVVGIALGDVRMASGEMSSDEAERGIVILQPDADCALVSRHASKTRLLRLLVS